MSSFYKTLRNWHVRHEQLKKFVHEGMRYPLPPAGQYAMGFVYFMTPVVGGYFVMQWAMRKANDNIGENGEKLPNGPLQGLGDKRMIAATGEMVPVGGADGWGGGVRLVNSNEEMQRKNNEKLDKFLRKMKRRQEKERKSN
jgi:hypothetical protein